MEKPDFKFTKEMAEIMKDSRELASMLDLNSITLEIVLDKLFGKYLSVGGESKIIQDMVKNLSSQEISDLRAMLKSEASNSGMKAILPRDSEFIPMDNTLEDIVYRARGGKALKSFISNGDTVDISAEDFLESALFEDDINVIKKLGNYKFGKESFLRKTLDNLSIPGDSRKNDILKKPSIKVFGGEKVSEEEMDNIIGKLLDGTMSSPKDKISSKKKKLTKEEIEESDKLFEKAGQDSGPISTKKVSKGTKTPFLDQFATDMTKKAEDGEYDPVIGRDLEISKMTEALCCKKKNNVLLLGDPGTGKTSIVEHLAQKIASGEVPFELKNKRLFNLDLNSMVAGTQFRGQYEERLQNVIEEVIKAKNIIVFIDEFHNLIGHGGGRDGQGADQILKPYLARGEFQCIGSTTEDEYRKLVENDKALDRRFQPIMVSEPSIEETKLILKGIADNYAKFHHVKYSEDVLNACVVWSEKYINNLFFPDKAIGILDKASSKAKLTNPSVETQELDKLAKTKAELINKKVNIICNETPDNWKEADNINFEIDRIDKEIELKEAFTDETKWPEVTIEHVSKSISELSGVPIDKIMSSDMGKIKSMYSEFTTKVIGQDEASLEITKAMQRNILGLRDPNKPIASFLFVGNTGTGKSYISKILAKEFMGSEKNLETIACSEYMQDWAESKLLGSAPGYVGFSDTKPRLYVLKRKPYCVLLIDEIEKSSNNLYNIWLQMLEEGNVTLSSGEKLSLKNCIIIFTGNVGTKSLELKGSGLGFNKLSGDDKKKADIETVMKEVKKEFRPEFLNRLTKIVVFNPLGKDELKKIFTLELAKLQERLQDKFNLTVSDKVRDHIIDLCEPQYGARSLQRLIIENIEENICTKMLDTDVTGMTDIFVDMTDDKVNVQFTSTVRA